MGRKRYPPDTVAVLRAALAEAELPPPRLSARQVVTALADDLRAMLAQGWTVDQLVEVLARNQIDLMPTTLQGYLRQPKTAKASKPRPRGKAKRQKEQTPTTAPSAPTVPTKAEVPSTAKADHEAFDEDIELFLDELGPD